MSTCIVLAPIIIANWPVIVAVVGAAVGTLGFSTVQHCESEISEACGATREEIDVENMPTAYSLAQNYPNPFNPSTKIEFGLPTTSRVSIRIHDILGRHVDEILSGSIPAGHHSVTWECGACSSGLYLIVMETPGFRSAKKAIFLR